MEKKWIMWCSWCEINVNIYWQFHKIVNFSDIFHFLMNEYELHHHWHEEMACTRCTCENVIEHIGMRVFPAAMINEIFYPCNMQHDDIICRLYIFSAFWHDQSTLTVLLICIFDLFSFAIWNLKTVYKSFFLLSYPPLILSTSSLVFFHNHSYQYRDEIDASIIELMICFIFWYFQFQIIIFQTL